VVWDGWSRAGKRRPETGGRRREVLVDTSTRAADGGTSDERQEEPASSGVEKRYGLPAWAIVRNKANWGGAGWRPETGGGRHASTGVPAVPRATSDEIRLARLGDRAKQSQLGGRQAGDWRREAPMDASTLLHKPPPAARDTRYERSLLRAESRRDTRLAAGPSCETKPISAFAGCQWGAGRV
jgi:hypothetical protein